MKGKPWKDVSVCINMGEKHQNDNVVIENITIICKKDFQSKFLY